MKKQRLISVISAILFTFISAPAFASYIYNYTGNNYSLIIDSDPLIGPTYDTSMNVTGMIKLAAPLGPNLTLQDVSPISYSFNDGVQTLTENSINVVTEIFEFSTDGSGIITLWNVDIRTNHPSNVGETDTQKIITTTASGVSDIGGVETCITYDIDRDRCATITDDRGFNRNNPGTWAVVPIPSALWLFGSGLLGLIGIARRKNAA